MRLRSAWMPQILITAGACLTLLVQFAGCEQLDLRSQGPDLDETDQRESEDATEVGTKLETRLIGDYTTIAGLNRIRLKGVGLVVGLKNTGGDPPPTYFRTAVLEEMKKQGVERPNQLLASDSTAVVMIEADLPALIKEGEKFDVRVMLPANSEATSLKGGWLLETRLTEQAIVPGQGVLKGHTLGIAHGPIMVDTTPTGGGERVSIDVMLREGRIPGGAVSSRDRNLSLYLRNDYRSVRIAKRVADRIGARFHHYNRSGSREPLAEAKTDQLVELKLHPTYKHNMPRYLQVVRSIAGNETPVAARLRFQKLREEIFEPKTAERASLQLEGMGADTIPLLKSALRGKHIETRFHAAQALAYLNDPSGLKVLYEAARDEPAFRVFALAAMCAVEDGDTNVYLKELLKEDEAETRYGAFRALTTTDPYDPDVQPVRMEDAHFKMYLMPSEERTTPLIHLTHNQKAELVLFGNNLRFVTPLTLRAGNHILVTAAPGSTRVTVSRFQLGKDDQIREVSNSLPDVIRTVVEMNGRYPDIGDMLIQADRQGNLPGRLEIDALPRAGRYFTRPSDGTRRVADRTRIGTRFLVPNAFSLPTDGNTVREDDTDEPEEPRLRLTSAEEESDSQPVRTASFEVTEMAPPDEPVMDEKPDSESDRPSVWRRLNPGTWFGDDE